jgi:hypothetical protein
MRKQAVDFDALQRICSFGALLDDAHSVHDHLRLLAQHDTLSCIRRTNVQAADDAAPRQSSRHDLARRLANRRHHIVRTGQAPCHLVS